MEKHVAELLELFSAERQGGMFFVLRAWNCSAIGFACLGGVFEGMVALGLDSLRR